MKTSDFAEWRNHDDHKGRHDSIVRIGWAFYCTLNAGEQQRMFFQEFEPKQWGDKIQGRFGLSETATGEWAEYFGRYAKRKGVNRKCQYCGNEAHTDQCVSCGSRKFSVA